MLDWKNRTGKTDASDGVNAGTTGARTRRYVGGLGGLLLSRALITLVVVYLVVTGALGWYWSTAPELFPVQQNAQMAAERDGRR